MKQNLNHLKPGLYAVWYFDCWDVDGDLYYTLATQDANQLWREEGTGLDMLRHQGDTFLKAWALDDASNLLAQSNNNLQLTQQSLKPGLYAIHYFDNGDPGNEPTHILVTLDDNLKWYNHEKGREMFMSEGDMVLKAWALDDASNLLAKTVDPSQLVDIVQKNEIQQRFLADLDI